MKIFSGNETLGLELQSKIEFFGIQTVVKKNNQSNKILEFKKYNEILEIFIQETDFAKANPIIENFRMSI